MRISDWSSDVCSSDLDRLAENEEPGGSRDGHHPADDEHVAAGPGGNARHQQPASDHGLAVRTLFLHQGHRSEEHTSELQSLMRISYAVFCLKKKNKHKHIKSTKNTLSI